MSYDEYVRKNILEPLGLKDLYPDIDHLTSNGRTDLFIKSFDLPHQDATISYAVGVMTGTAEGLLEWEKKVMDKALLSSQSWDKILDGGAFGYGYGWYIENGYIEHSGMTLGYNTNVRVASDSGRVIIVLSNIQLLEGSDKKPMGFAARGKSHRFLLALHVFGGFPSQALRASSSHGPASAPAH